VFGSLEPWRDVIEHYDTFKRLGLAEQKVDLIEYLKSLWWKGFERKTEGERSDQARHITAASHHRRRGAHWRYCALGST
jgi:hypothetical protein